PARVLIRFGHRSDDASTARTSIPHGRAGGRKRSETSSTAQSSSGTPPSFKGCSLPPTPVCERYREQPDLPSLTQFQMGIDKQSPRIALLRRFVVDGSGLERLLVLPPR